MKQPLNHIKNKKTSFNYKRYVRILKNIRKDLNFDKIGSFQLESLLWNLPDSLFRNNTYCLEIGVQNIINYLYDNRYQFRIFKEGNGIKQLALTDDVFNSLITFVTILYTTVEVFE